jgi:hypothetical protein
MPRYIVLKTLRRTFKSDKCSVRVCEEKWFSGESGQKVFLEVCHSVHTEVIQATPAVLEEFLPFLIVQSLGRWSLDAYMLYRVMRHGIGRTETVNMVL